MGESNVNLAALIGSRICHDLISPIGAIANGLELLDLTGTAPGPEMALIADSAGHAGARIRFFRIAYGGPGQQSMGRAEVVSILHDLGQASRFRMDWAVPDAQPRAQVRLAFLALQCLETAMPFGGDASVGMDAQGWVVSGRSDKLNVDAALWSRLSGHEPEPDSGADSGISPALVQFALLPELAAELGRDVTWAATASAITLRF
ncbi:MAG: histidine phosphotransferase [Rhodobacteraceae bacterium]|nr:histidine phosphotransferase [Paracoccaceae bacterium]